MKHKHGEMPVYTVDLDAKDFRCIVSSGGNAKVFPEDDKNITAEEAANMALIATAIASAVATYALDRKTVSALYNSFGLYVLPAACYIYKMYGMGSVSMMAQQSVEYKKTFISLVEKHK